MSTTANLFETTEFFCNFDEHSTINENICGGFEYKLYEGISNIEFIQLDRLPSDRSVIITDATSC